MKPDFLKKIVEWKKSEVADARRRLPESRLREQAEKPRTRRLFYQKLRHTGKKTEVYKPNFEVYKPNIIAEIKRASPSKGIIRHDLNPAEYALEYEKGGAACISVLTDEHYFQGSIEDLKAARNAASLPVLRKDFLIDAYQIYESAAIGADAVLLIVRILTPEQLRDYLSLCKELQLDALVEVHSEDEFKIAAYAGAVLIGINNRNLETFQTDINTSLRIAPLFSEHQLAVAESGIRTRSDIETLLNAGIYNFLIGESIVRASNPSQYLKDLRFTI